MAQSTDFGKAPTGYSSCPTGTTPEETGTVFVQKAKDIGAGVVEKVKDAALTMAKATEDFAGKVGEKAKEATAAVGSGVQTVAHKLESGGRYIKEAGFRGMADDVATLIRNHPLPALCVGLGLGFLLSRACRNISLPGCEEMNMHDMAKASNKPS